MPDTGDLYESDDSCEQASTIPTDGTVQHHTFHQQNDTDWVSFELTAGTKYLIEAQVPPESQADMSIVLYDQCNGSVQAAQNHSFSPTIRLEFTAQNDGTLLLELYNQPPKVFGSNVSYNLSVRALNQNATPGALIIVAGRLRSNDDLQDNIHFVTNAVYDLFLNQAYTDERIYYLATDPSLIGFDGEATVANLQTAITSWALDKVGPDEGMLTLYLIDHGDRNRLYLDKARNEWVTPDQLDSWLSEFQAAKPEVKVNVIIEAGYTGSFIKAPQTISRPGRVVIASTGAEKLAWASEKGAIFSDHFLAALGRQASLLGSFQAANWAVQSTPHNQTAWLDANGNSIPNEAEDEAIAALRHFAYAGTTGKQWPPYIAQVPIPVVQNGRAEIQAEVRDDFEGARVWAVIYPPSYEAPNESEELVQENLQTTLLLDQGNNMYGATYSGFDQKGTYRVVVYAEDQDGQPARPMTIEVEVNSPSHQFYLPLMMK